MLIRPRKTHATADVINALRRHIEKRKDALTSLEQDIRKNILTYFFDNFKFPTMEDIQYTFNLDYETVLAVLKKLDEFDAIQLGEDKKTIKASYPFSSVETDYKVFRLDKINDNFWHATCAIDSLGIAYMFDVDIRIEAISAFQKNKIKVVIKNGEVVQVSHGKIIVFGGTTYCSKAINSVCSSLLFFSSEGEYEEWREYNINIKGEKLGLEGALYVSKIIFQNRLNEKEIVYENMNDAKVKQHQSNCSRS